MTSLRDLRQEGRVGTFEILSLLLFALMSVAAFGFLAYAAWVFVALIIIDVLGTLTSISFIVSFDRALLFFAVVALFVQKSSFNIFFMTIVIMILFATLDFSFLLRQLDGTRVDASVMTARLKSYVFTVLPALLVTYALVLYLYSINIQFSAVQAMVVLGLSSVGVLVVIYTIASYLLSFENRKTDMIQ